MIAAASVGVNAITEAGHGLAPAASGRPKARMQGRIHRWSLQTVELQVSLLFAKVKFIFGRKVPEKVSTKRRKRVQKTICTELVLAQQNSESPNAVAGAFVEIAQRERKKAIRKGDYATAIVAAVVDQTV